MLQSIQLLNNQCPCNPRCNLKKNKILQHSFLKSQILKFISVSLKGPNVYVHFLFCVIYLPIVLWHNIVWYVHLFSILVRWLSLSCSAFPIKSAGCFVSLNCVVDTDPSILCGKLLKMMYRKLPICYCMATLMMYSLIQPDISLTCFS